MNPAASGDAEPDTTQVVRAVNGFAYGCIGADIHIFGDGTPVYLLFEHRRTSGLDPRWQRAQPSRMLDARAEVVDFTGRDAELGELIAWRDEGPRFKVRWLHGEGGQGKTRLANQLADSEPGWKVVDATHRTDAHPPEGASQDLRLDGHSGVLLLVDYADRWPVSDLSWLLQNRLLRQGVPTRVLLIARSASGWSAIQGMLDRLRENIDTSDQKLSPLPQNGDDRDRMFTTARDCFARRYPEVAHPESITPPGPLSHADFGLTLAVLMAALVAVDAAARGRRAPADMVGMTAYLLNREHENWRQLYENQTAGLDYRTPDSVMARTVFTAALIGPTARPTGRDVLEKLELDPPAGVTPDDILDDHATCYRPTDPDRTDVLGPMQPDRLVEDFLALTLPGSPVTGYPTDGWAATAVKTLLARQNGAQPAWTPRAITLLASAADRWPHVGDQHLYSIVLADPQLALDAGSAALTALAQIGTTAQSAPAADGDVLAEDLLSVLTAVWNIMPGSHLDLDPGLLAVTERVAAHRLATTTDPDQHARLHSMLAFRRFSVGDAEAAVTAAEEAALLFRGLAKADPTAYLPDVGMSQSNLSAYLTCLEDRLEEAHVRASVAADLLRELAEANPAHLSELVSALMNLGSCLARLGDREKSLDVISECANLSMRLMVHYKSATYMATLAASFSKLSNELAHLGRGEEALSFVETSVNLQRLLAQEEPESHLPALASAIGGLRDCLAARGRLEQALDAAEEAVAIGRRLAEANPGAYRQQFAMSLHALGAVLADMGRAEEAIAAGEQAAALFHIDGDRYGEGRALQRLALILARLERHEESIPAGERAAALFSEFGDRPNEADTLLALGHSLARTGQREKCAVAYQQAATLYRAITAPDKEAEALINRGRALLEMGRLEESIPASRRAATLFRDLHELNAERAQLIDAEVGALYNLGAALKRLRRWDEAIANFRQGAALCSMIGNPAGEGLMLFDLAGALEETKRFDEASTFLTQAAGLAHQTGDRQPEAMMLGTLGRVLMKMGRFDESIAASRQAAAIFRALGNRNGEATALDNLNRARERQTH